jgi:hypothetical protein
MTETLSDSGMVKLKAGANVSTALTAANYTQLINEAEAYLVDFTKTDLLTLSGATTTKRYMLQDYVSSMAAVGAINYNMSGFTSRQESLIMVNILWAKCQEVLRILKDVDVRSWILKP